MNAIAPNSVESIQANIAARKAREAAAKETHRQADIAQGEAARGAAKPARKAIVANAVFHALAKEVFPGIIADFRADVVDVVEQAREEAQAHNAWAMAREWSEAPTFRDVYASLIGGRYASHSPRSGRRWVFVNTAGHRGGCDETAIAALRAVGFEVYRSTSTPRDAARRVLRVRPIAAAQADPAPEADRADA